MIPLPRLLVIPGAKADIKEAKAWYRGRSHKAAGKFVRALGDCIGGIRQAPQRYPVIYGKVRHALLDGFPYAIFFIAEEGRIRIIACMHERRDPQDWMDRA